MAHLSNSTAAQWVVRKPNTAGYARNVCPSRNSKPVAARR